MTEQLQLGVQEVRSKKRIAPPEEIDALIGVLAGEHWLSARQVRKKLLKRTGRKWGEKRIRDAASQSKGQVLSGPSSPGYMLTREASPEDRNAAVGPLQSQIASMQQRVTEINRVWHRGGSATSQRGNP